MGAKTWMLVYSDGDAREALSRYPPLERDATQTFAQMLFPGERLRLLGDGDLSCTSPPDNELIVGCFAGVSIVAAKEFGIDRPSALLPRFVAAGGSGIVTLHAMHSVVDWFAFARWTDGHLVRSLSLSPDSGIIEDMGPKLPFEGPYWAGEYSVADGEETDNGYPFPFHPLELGEAALSALFGYQIEGALMSTVVNPDEIPLVRYARDGSRWRFWR